MTATIPLAPSYVINWQAISTFADEEIIHALQINGFFTSTQTFRHKIYEACRILYIEHHHAIPYSMIGWLFRIAKATVRYH
jgi:hypothetical protein